ncbi:MAG: S41 family peptidase [Chloroflexi bacterium]|nr:MAG: S41 family peptidase [Chloroflexota bacterium]MBL1193332.1 S41 family peptidase [Chloroflexota bacterium]NOH10624.1 S41 family peptidase [Chloroflexota bacterium]
MNRRNLIFAGVGAFVLLGMCVVLLGAGFLSYTFFSTRAADTLLAEPPVSVPLELPADVAEEPVELPQTPIGADVDLRSLFKPFWESQEFLHDNFYRQPIDNAVLAQGAIEGLEFAIEDYNVDLDTVILPADAPTTADISSEADTPNNVETEFESFWAMWGKLEYADLGADLSYEILMQSALRGMVQSLDDPYTNYFDPQENLQANIPLNGEYEGIGAWVDTTSDYLTIIAPMPGSPAEGAGLLPGDAIIAIDGDDMTGIDGSLVIRRVLGPADSEVILTIQREDVEEPFDVSVIRARITIPNVEGEILENDIAYVQLFNFGGRTPVELRAVLEDLLAQNPQGLILDLRNNGGGFLDSAVEITSEFVDDGVVLYEEFSDGNRISYDVRSGGVATDIPLIVLVNGGTASASEILAGVIQDYERGILVGTTTFGKGSVQQPITLSDNQGGLRITIAIWLTPDERHIHDIGLDPDFIIEITEEDLENQVDPQLEKAIELIIEG